MELKDYGESSKFYKDEYKEYKKELEKVEKHKTTFMWITEFSKKVVVVIFVAYILMAIFSCVMVFLSMRITGMVSGLETLITEMNTTFRDIVGGYLVKAGVENAVKIGGNYYVGVADARLRELRERLNLKGKDTFETDDCSDGASFENFDEES